MKLTGQQFLDQPHKRITLIGMSGVGKSHTAAKVLGASGWHNYSCDYLIATKYLAKHLSGGEITETNIERLADFVGQIGNPAKGGKALHDFNTYQRLYYNAECAVLRDIVAEGIKKAEREGKSFVNDSSGSLCEVEDESILRQVGTNTLIIYLKATQSDYANVLRRALENPKPLYFPPDFFNAHLKKYKADFNLQRVEDINPGDFLIWVFPRLLEARLPKYQRLADEYGVTIPSDALYGIKSEKEFINLVARALDAQAVEPGLHRSNGL